MMATGSYGVSLFIAGVDDVWVAGGRSGVGAFDTVVGGTDVFVIVGS